MTKIHYKTFPEEKYACNEAVNPNELFMTRDWKAISCKNCLKQKLKRTGTKPEKERGREVIDFGKN